MRTFVQSDKPYKEHYFRSILKSFQDRQVYSQGDVFISKHRNYTVWKKGKYGPVVLARRDTFAAAKGVIECH
jgi:hypothetical protein